MTVLISRDAFRIIHIFKSIRCLESVIHHNYLKAARGTYIIITVRGTDDTPYRIGRQTAGLVEHIYDLLPDHYRQTVVVGTDPQASFFINIQAVYVFNRFIIIHPAEFTSVITVETRIGSDPEYSVVGLLDIICFTAGQTVVTAVNILDIIVIIDCFHSRCRLRPYRRTKTGPQRQNNDKRCCPGTVIMLCRAGIIMTFMEISKNDNNINGSYRQDLIGKLQ